MSDTSPNSVAAARVIPNVAAFSVDNGFWYSIPDHLSDDVVVGRIVRVPLSGRRVRGWVVEAGRRDPERLKPIAAVSGDCPVFDDALLSSLKWAANHYVAPMSVLLSKATPPNLPKRRIEDLTPPDVTGDHALSGIASRSAEGKGSPIAALVGQWRDLAWLASVGPVVAAGKSVMIVASTQAEVAWIAMRAQELFGESVVDVSGDDDASLTMAWERLQKAPKLIVGSPRTASWLVPQLGLVVVVEESRRAMKDRQTPTIHVRDLMIIRSRIERFNLAFLGPTPGVELLANGAELKRVGKRAWPWVEVVDRSEDRGRLIADRTMAAIKGAVASGHEVFVFTHRRKGSASTTCAKCRMIRRCESCGWRLGAVASCPNCDNPAGPCVRCSGETFEEMGSVPERVVAELNRLAGREIASVFPGDASVNVGTERDLATLSPVYLAVAADVDGMLMGTGYRTEEEALRQLARLASTLTRESGSRLMIQTSSPDSELVTTVRRGDPIPYIERVLVERARDELPPSSEMIALEVRGESAHDAELRELPGHPTVLGPLTQEGTRRWLISGRLGKARLELRSIVGRWRDSGHTVRVDADPIDV